MIYVGSAESEDFDQILDTIYVGPIPEGRHMFVFQVKHYVSTYYIVYHKCRHTRFNDYNILHCFSLLYLLFLGRSTRCE